MFAKLDTIVRNPKVQETAVYAVGMIVVVGTTYVINSKIINVVGSVVDKLVEKIYDNAAISAE